MPDDLNSQLSQLNILLPKLLGSIAGAVIGGLIAYLGKHYGWAVDPDLQSLLTQFFTGLGSLLGYAVVEVVTAKRTNPANVASAKAATPATPGQPNVTSEPT